MSDETEMVAKMFDRVIAERDAARAQVAKLTQERDEARAAAEAMGRPVSDEEWDKVKYPVGIGTGAVNGETRESDFRWHIQTDRAKVDALISARVRDSKEADNGKNGR